VRAVQMGDCQTVFALEHLASCEDRCILGGHSLYLLYWYKSTNTQKAPLCQTLTRKAPFASNTDGRCIVGGQVALYLREYPLAQDLLLSSVCVCVCVYVCVCVRERETETETERERYRQTDSQPDTDTETERQTVCGDVVRSQPAG
jgi:hypothetical protein